jgi:hypothetical protein
MLHKSMLDLKQDITSLSNFQRNTRDLVQRLRDTGRPPVLTVNGRAELVVQEAAAYQRLLTLAVGTGAAE